MVTKTQKIKHIETWILAKDKDFIKKAAELAAQTINEFIADAAINAAHQILKDAEKQKNFDEAMKNASSRQNSLKVILAKNI